MVTLAEFFSGLYPNTDECQHSGNSKFAVVLSNYWVSRAERQRHDGIEADNRLDAKPAPRTAAP